MSEKTKPRVQVTVARRGSTVDVTLAFTNLTPQRAVLLESLMKRPISTVVPDLEDSTREVVVTQKKTRLTP